MSKIGERWAGCNLKIICTMLTPFSGLRRLHHTFGISLPKFAKLMNGENAFL
jgi:hypothetical protein